MKITMVLDCILVNRDVRQQKIGSIVIPESCSEERPEGVVVAVGPGRLASTGRHVPMDVKVGDHICWREGAGSDFEIRGQRHLILREDDVFGILEETRECR